LKSDINFLVRRLTENEEIPYHLLLLADDTMEAIDRYVHEAEIHVCETDKRLVAVFVLKVVSNDCIEIKNIAVDSDYQGKGIGTHLLNKAYEIAMTGGYRSLLIGTGDHCVRELEWYEKSGFIKFKIIKDFFVNNYPEPIYENGKQLTDMIVLKKDVKDKN
jgi:ribosomal protein S18 acetylase RimI-like enzyme